MENKDVIELWEQNAQNFEGDPAMYWAGRMSIAAFNLYHASLFNSRPWLEILEACRTKYDTIIFERTQ